MKHCMLTQHNVLFLNGHVLLTLRATQIESRAVNLVGFAESKKHYYDTCMRDGTTKPLLAACVMHQAHHDVATNVAAVPRASSAGYPHANIKGTYHLQVIGTAA